MIESGLKDALISFLQSSRAEIDLEGIGVFSREGAAARLRDLIPTEIQVRNICAEHRGIVVAAPHVSFDGWSEYFARITSEQFPVGRVVAKHFRDDNGFDIPVSIGRHIHVNRPTESRKPRGREFETERSREAYADYISALKQAGGSELPLNLLIEFHGHRRHDTIDIATTGIDAVLAAELKAAALEGSDRKETKLRIEPIDKVLFLATRAKSTGSLQQGISRRALHIELPRQLRRPEEQRAIAWSLLRPMIAFLLRSIPHIQ